MQDVIANPFQQTIERLSLASFRPLPCDFPYLTRFYYVSDVTGIENLVSIQVRPFSGDFMFSIGSMIDYHATHEDVIRHLNSLP